MVTTGQGLCWLLTERLNTGEWADRDKGVMKEQMIRHCLVTFQVTEYFGFVHPSG